MTHVPVRWFFIHRLCILSVSLAIGLLGEISGNAAKILFVINTVTDPTTTANANDQEVRDRLTTQGHTVTLAEDDSVSAGDTTGMDLVLISSSTSSTAAGLVAVATGTLRAGRIPFICYEPALYDELLMQRDTTYGNANGHTSLAITAANTAHPLAAGKSGTIEIVAPGEVATVSSSAVPLSIGTDATIIATNATPAVDVGRIAIWAYDVGARVADNTTAATSRRVAFFFNASTTPGVYNSNATDLFDAALKWALQPPATIPVSIVSLSPAANQAAVAADASIVVEVDDGSTAQVNQSSIKLTVNGSPVTPTVTKTGARTRISFKPATPFGSGQGVKVELTFNDTGTPPKVFTSAWQFTTERQPTAPAAFRQTDLGLVVIETENFHTNTPGDPHRWLFATTPAGFAGDGTMYALPDSGSDRNMPDALTLAPRLDYKVQFTKTGTHYFWFRGSDGGGDSLHAGIDDVDPTGSTLDNMDEGCCGDRAAGGISFTWVGGIDATPEGRASFEVPTAGAHTIRLWMRENGQIVDKFLITTDPNFVPTGVGPEESRRVGEPVKPVVTITSPAEGATIPASGQVAITANATDADGTVAKVEFFEADNKIGEDTTAPFSISWKPSKEQSYTLTAKVTDNSGDSATSAPVRIVFGNPPKILYLGNNPTANAGDMVVIRRLESKGFQVTAIDDNDSQTSDADGKALVVISSTVSSGNIVDKFTAVAVPMVNWEEAIMDDLLFTGDSGADPDHHGSTGGQTALDILNPTHPLAAGLPAGPVVVSTSPQTFSWGFPEANAKNAIVVAALAGSTNQIGIYAYEKGATLFDGVTKAAARRVSFFFNGDSTTAANDAAFKLFDAALNWALNITVPTEPPKLAASRSANNLVISWTGTGTLQQADAITGPWANAPSQSNPQTVQITGTAKFYRIRQ